MNRQFYKSNLASETYLQNSIEYTLNEVSNLMKVCYGPYGSHVLIANNMGAEAMKDGQRILSAFNPNGTIAKSVMQSIKSVANKQAEEIGDGTTTTILLLCELYKKFREIIENHGMSPSTFNAKLKNVTEKIIETLPNYTKTLIEATEDESIEHIDWDTLRSAIHTSVDANTELTDVIISMFKELKSIDPLVIIDTSTTPTHRYELVKGLELDGAPISPEIFFNGYSRKNINVPNVVVINGRMEASVEYIMELDNSAMQTNSDYIFLCTGINDDTLSTLVTLKNTNPALLNHVTFFQIRLTGSDEEFLDACASLGASPIDSETLSKVSSLAGFMKVIDINSGTCEKSLVTEFCIRFNHPNSDDERVQERLDDIQKKIDDINNDPTSHNDNLKHLEDRKAFLSKNYAKLYIGGTSPQRRSINYELAKDGVFQAISCLKHGVVEGCNTVVPYACTIIDTDDFIEDDIACAIGESYDELFRLLLANKVGHDNVDLEAKTLGVFNDNFNREMINIRDNDDTPVLNSAATDRTILENATDMAALLATSKAYLSNVAEFDSLNNQ